LFLASLMVARPFPKAANRDLDFWFFFSFFLCFRSLSFSLACLSSRRALPFSDARFSHSAVCNFNFRPGFYLVVQHAAVWPC